MGTNVTSIGDWAFSQCTSLTSLVIPDSVTNVGDYVSAYCSSLTGIYFQGNAPNIDSFAFDNENYATIYYLPGTTGWGATFGGAPTALWKPWIDSPGTSFGVQTNQFGFDINWASGRTVVVEACTNLANPIWHPIGTNTITAGSSYFSDPAWTNYHGRFYRFRSP
jgi:hypothetical protein